jgi:hypothetical protein
VVAFHQQVPAVSTPTATQWTNSLAPPSLRRQLQGGVDFMGPGLCSSHPGVTHQYTTVTDHNTSPYWRWAGRFHLGIGPYWLRFTYVAPVLVTKYWGRKRPGSTVDFADLYDTSCLNGWTCGNIAARPTQLARMVHHLFSPSIPAGQRLLTNHSLTQMQVGIGPYWPRFTYVTPFLITKHMAQHWTPFTGAFATGYLYGLGLMIYDIGELSGKTDGIPKRFTTLIGHAGQDYGSGAASVASFGASVLTEIYLCSVCSCQ